jgi:hypothetical protein
MVVPGALDSGPPPLLLPFEPPEGPKPQLGTKACALYRLFRMGAYIYMSPACLVTPLQSPKAKKGEGGGKVGEA